MKKYFLSICLCALAALAFTQSKPTNVNSGKPSIPDMSTMNPKDLAAAWDDENRLVPKKDAARIASIAKGVTSARMKNYVQAVHAKVGTALGADVATTGEAIYAYLEKEGISKEERGNNAMGLWVSGNQRIALFVLGKICADTATTNDLNNYASMLSLMGGEQLAVPILDNLVTNIPGNIILLNNLGQAWFGLGDLTKAEKYLNSAVDIYPNHPQANYSIAEIAESKGETAKAIELIKKSIQHAYTKEKQDKLRKLGYKIKLEDLRVPFKPGPDPILLSRYKRPTYPKSVSESILLKPQWESFKEVCENEMKKLGEELRQATEKYSADVQKISAGDMQAASSFMQVPIYMTKASLEMNNLKSYSDLMQKQLVKSSQSCSDDLERIKKERQRCRPEEPCTCHRDAESDFLRKYNERKQIYDEEALRFFRQYFGEMVYWSQYTSMDDTQFEIIKLQLLTSYLAKLGSAEFQPEFATYTYEDCIDENEGKPFILPEFDFTTGCKYNATIRYPFITQTINCSHTTTTFDASFLKNLPIFGVGYKKTIVERGTEFERSTVVITPKFGISAELVPLPIEAGITAEGTVTINTDKAGKTDWNAVVKAGVELGVGKSLGPVKVKAIVGESVELEFDSKGHKDVNLITEAKIKAEISLPGVDKENPANKEFNDKVGLANKGAKIADMNVKMGFEDRVSLMTGHVTVQGNGVLKSLVIAKY